MNQGGHEGEGGMAGDVAFRLGKTGSTGGVSRGTRARPRPTGVDGDQKVASNVSMST